MNMSPEALSTIIEILGGPSVLGLVLYFLYIYGPGKEVTRISKDLSEIKDEFKQDRSKFYQHLRDYDRRLYYVEERIKNEREGDE